MSNTTRMLCLPPTVLNLASLSWPARLVLAEILDLHKVNGQVWANDQHFVKRLPGTSMRTVQRAIQELVTASHIIRETNQAAQHKRILTPMLVEVSESEPPAKLATDPADLPPIWREPIAKLAADLSPVWQEAPAKLADINYHLNTKGKEQEKDAAPAASPTLLSAKSEAKRPAARTEELAALQLPHLSPEFAKAWAEFAAGPKQRKKPLTALQRLLATLSKYQEGFALKMLGRAIEHDWSGVEYDNTADAYARWQAEQTRHAAQSAPNTAKPITPVLNQEVVAEREAQKQAAFRAHLAKHAARPADE